MKKKEAGNGRAGLQRDEGAGAGGARGARDRVAARKPRLGAKAGGGPAVVGQRVPLPDDRPAPCPVCGRPFHLFGAPCAVFVGPPGFLPACGHCAAVLRAAGVPSGRVLAGVMPDGSPVVTDAFNLAPDGSPPN